MECPAPTPRTARLARPSAVDTTQPGSARDGPSGTGDRWKRSRTSHRFGSQTGAASVGARPDALPLCPLRFPSGGCSSWKRTVGFPAPKQELSRPGRLGPRRDRPPLRLRASSGSGVPDDSSPPAALGVGGQSHAASFGGSSTRRHGQGSFVVACTARCRPIPESLHRGCRQG